MMQPFAIRGIGELWLAALRPSAMSELFYRVGIADRRAAPRGELQAHYHLLKRADGGRAFLEVMRGFELTREKEDLLRRGLAERRYPAQIVWGELDPAIRRDQLQAAQGMLGIENPLLLAAKHFPQEDQAPAVASAIAALAAPLG
jgi:pimeloyl-ACP methyl ester carboxylesterase